MINRLSCLVIAIAGALLISPLDHSAYRGAIAAARPASAFWTLLGSAHRVTREDRVPHVPVFGPTVGWTIQLLFGSNIVFTSSAVPNMMDFGTLEAGSSVQGTIEVNNLTGQSLSISCTTADLQHFAVSCPSIVDQEGTATVSFQAVGADHLVWSTVLFLRAQGATSGFTSATVLLQGSILNPPTVLPSSTAITTVSTPVPSPTTVTSIVATPPPHLQLLVSGLATRVHLGATLTAQLLTAQEAHVTVQARDAHSHAIPRSAIKVYVFSNGLHILQMTIGRSVPPGWLRLTINASLGSQRVSVRRQVLVSKR